MEKYQEPFNQKLKNVLERIGDGGTLKRAVIELRKRQIEESGKVDDEEIVGLIDLYGARDFVLMFGSSGDDYEENLVSCKGTATWKMEENGEVTGYYCKKCAQHILAMGIGKKQNFTLTVMPMIEVMEDRLCQGTVVELENRIL